MEIPFGLWIALRATSLVMQLDEELEVDVKVEEVREVDNNEGKAS